MEERREELLDIFKQSILNNCNINKNKNLLRIETKNGLTLEINSHRFFIYLDSEFDLSSFTIKLVNNDEKIKITKNEYDNLINLYNNKFKNLKTYKNKMNKNTKKEIYNITTGTGDIIIKKEKGKYNIISNWKIKILPKLKSFFNI